MINGSICINIHTKEIIGRNEWTLLACNIYLSHRIIDSFPRISKGKILRLKRTSFVSREGPKARADKTGF